MGLLTDRIDNALEKSNLINEHALNREPVPLIVPILNKIQLFRNLKVYQEMHGLPDTLSGRLYISLVNSGVFELLYFVQYRHDKHQT